MKINIGHEAPVISVSCVSGTGMLVSCDINGFLKMWDITTNTQILAHHIDVLRVKAMTVISRHKKILIASKKDFRSTKKLIFIISISSSENSSARVYQSPRS